MRQITPASSAVRLRMGVQPDASGPLTSSRFKNNTSCPSSPARVPSVPSQGPLDTLLFRRPVSRVRLPSVCNDPIALRVVGTFQEAANADAAHFRGMMCSMACLPLVTRASPSAAFSSCHPRLWSSIASRTIRGLAQPAIGEKRAEFLLQFLIVGVSTGSRWIDSRRTAPRYLQLETGPICVATPPSQRRPCCSSWSPARACAGPSSSRRRSGLLRNGASGTAGFGSSNHKHQRLDDFAFQHAGVCSRTGRGDQWVRCPIRHP